MKKLLVSGGAGFIGSNLCERLLKCGDIVYCIDNFVTGTRRNVEKLLEYKNFILIEHDVVNPIDLDVNKIYNLACPASPVNYQERPLDTIKSSVFGVYNMLELALKNNAKFLQASTSEVYGDPLVHPQREDYRGNVNPVGPRSCYDEGKRLAETFCYEYFRNFNLNIKITRIFNTYGPGMAINDGRVVNNFIVSALKNKDITIFGDGTQSRSFCYVDDMITGLIMIMESDIRLGPINIGNTAEYTINELAEMVLKLTKSKSKKVFLPLPIDDPTKRRPDISFITQKLDWKPFVGIEEGLLKTIDYFKRILEE